MQSSIIEPDAEADEQVDKEWVCSFCGQILTDQQTFQEPCPLCDEWSFRLFQ